jgi:hypothetical protein
MRASATGAWEPPAAGLGRTGRYTDHEPNCANISGRLEDTTPSHQRPARGTNEDQGLRLAGTRVIRTQLMRSAAGRHRREEKIMPAIKATSTAPRQRTSPHNGLPEPVPYVYGQQTRRNTYAARIARRNVQGWWLPPAALPKPKLIRSSAASINDQG